MRRSGRAFSSLDNVGPEQLQRLPQLPDSRLCSCGGRPRWSHLEYVGRGSSIPIYTCPGCGLAYRGRQGSKPPSPARQSRRPLPDEGSPTNPVLGAELAEKLRQLLGQD